ncbi:hypothetical protein THIOM_001160 [Candidatus Thiomargarita nelsonii]|uniref:Uncharacterized protein n=1 Tax=Candidatus Thiomargarita nelsonii TaxID=1003181 RepID=A0A176S4T3_9GAMM|nr:hypothetical protein THIOM_001160 [Candidatus Thiomargarita nelsonii]
MILKTNKINGHIIYDQSILVDFLGWLIVISLFRSPKFILDMSKINLGLLVTCSSS